MQSPLIHGLDQEVLVPGREIDPESFDAPTVNASVLFFHHQLWVNQLPPGLLLFILFFATSPNH